ncbi:hypothetical protein ACIRBX_37580 [Kitasatospora sp. NPDC096147]|uniref:hypothetical protein n=1 Tax=Kitasatospora sp. NPDC096147 TaxID=3364093 RepID=UPI003815F46D
MAIEEPVGNPPALRTDASFGARQALATQLRPLFASLNQSYRAYGKRRHLTSSALCRYLNGDRVPPVEFLTGLFEDLAADGRPVSPADRDRLLGLRDRLLRTGSAVQQLESQLAECRKELSDCLQDQDALVRELACQESVLRSLEERYRTIRSDRARTRDEDYLRVERERDALRRQVDQLREELLRERAWALRTEEQCRHLVWRLRFASGPARRSGDLASLLNDMDHVPVGELAGLVARTQRRHETLATELIRAASRTRTVADTVALFAALDEAGTPQKAEAAVPDALRDRELPEVVELLTRLHRHRLDGCVAVALDTVALTRPGAFVHQVVARLDSGARSSRLGPALVTEAATRLRVPELAALLAALAGDDRLPGAAERCVDHAARTRWVHEQVEVTVLLNRSGSAPLAERLVTGVIQHRSPLHAANVLDELSRRGLDPLAGRAVDRLIRSEVASHVVRALAAMPHGTRDHRLRLLRQRCAASHPPAEAAAIAELLHSLNLSGQAAELAGAFLWHRSAEDVREFAAELRGTRSGRLVQLLSLATAGRPLTDLVEVADRLAEVGLPESGTALLAWAAGNRSTDDALALLIRSVDDPDGAPELTASAALRPRQSVAELLDALRRRGWDGPAEALLAAIDRSEPSALKSVHQAINRRRPPGGGPDSRAVPTAPGEADQPNGVALLRHELARTREELTRARRRADAEERRRKAAEDLVRKLRRNPTAPLGEGAGRGR